MDERRRAALREVLVAWREELADKLNCRSFHILPDSEVCPHGLDTTLQKTSCRPSLSVLMRRVLKVTYLNICRCFSYRSAHEAWSRGRINTSPSRQRPHDHPSAIGSRTLEEGKTFICRQSGDDYRNKTAMGCLASCRRAPKRSRASSPRPRPLAQVQALVDRVPTTREELCSVGSWRGKKHDLVEMRFIVIRQHIESKSCHVRRTTHSYTYIPSDLTVSLQ